MNPSSLKALVDQHSAGPSAAALGMAPPPPPDEEDDEDLDDEPEAPVVGPERGNELIESWGEFGKTLREEAKELADEAADVGAELLLTEVPEDAIKAVGKSVDGMPDELSMGLSKYVSALSPDDCESLAMALAAEAGDADPKLLCSFLLHAGQYAAEEIEVDEDFNAPEEAEAEHAEPDGDEGAPPTAPEA